jgi:hypothetical protein
MIEIYFFKRLDLPIINGSGEGIFLASFTCILSAIFGNFLNTLSNIFEGTSFWYRELHGLKYYQIYLYSCFLLAAGYAINSLRHLAYDLNKKD